MRSMYRFSIIALAVASLALIAAGTAFADYKAGGSITTGIQQTTSAPETGSSTSQLAINNEAIVDFSGTAGAVSGKMRLELNAGNHSVNNTRNYVRWQINDQLGLQFNGSSFGSDAGGKPFSATVVGHLTSVGGPGSYSGYAMWAVGGVNNPDLDVNFKLNAGMDLGLVISGGYDLYAADDDHETQTVVPYFNGKFGDITVRVYAASSSGKDSTDASIKANETSVHAMWSKGGTNAALTYVTGKYDDAFKTTGIAVSAHFGAIGVHYIVDQEEPDAGGDKTQDISDIGVAYVAPINDGATWGIGYGSTTDKVDGGSTSAALDPTKAKPGAGVKGSESRVIFSIQGKF